MPYMTRLEADIRAEFGDFYEVVTGWETRGNSSFAPAGTMCHWTAGPRSGDRPSLRVCTYGRPGLSGPLCNVFLTRAGKPIIVAAGRANHAGPGEFAGLRGNSSWYGIEAESTGVDGDRNWTDAQRRNYPRLAASMQRGLKRDERTVAGHSEYAVPRGRKIDINGYPMSVMRSSVKAALSRPGSSGNNIIPLPETPKDWFDMASTEDLAKVVSAHAASPAEVVQIVNDALNAHRKAGNFLGMTPGEARQQNEIARVVPGTHKHVETLVRDLTFESGLTRRVLRNIEAQGGENATHLVNLASEKVTVGQIAAAVDGLGIPEGVVDELAKRLAAAVTVVVTPIEDKGPATPEQEKKALEA